MSIDACIRNTLKRYHNPDLTRNEILRAHELFKDLNPTNSDFVSYDGSSKKFVSLSGTIPVIYRGKTYNIPICIYMPETYPTNPPFIYVKPTPLMQIKTGRHVDKNGLVYLPYLHEWSHPKSDLVGLIQILVMIFGEEPPVFAKPSSSSSSSSSFDNRNNPSLPYPQAYSSFPQPYSNLPSYIFPNSDNDSSRISDNFKKYSLLSAVEDRIKKEVKDALLQSQAEMDTLKNTQHDLEKGKENLERMIRKIEGDQEKLEEDIRIMKKKDEEVEELMNKMKLAEEVNIDDVINPTAPLYKQILNSYAEEQAIDDALYYLSEALRKGVLDLETFLKQVRDLSRKQFLLRMLINKCRKHASLPEIY